METDPQSQVVLNFFSDLSSEMYIYKPQILGEAPHSTQIDANTNSIRQPVLSVEFNPTTCTYLLQYQKGMIALNTRDADDVTLKNFFFSANLDADIYKFSGLLPTLPVKNLLDLYEGLTMKRARLMQLFSDEDTQSARYNHLTKKIARIELELPRRILVYFDEMLEISPWQLFDCVCETANRSGNYSELKELTSHKQKAKFAYLYVMSTLGDQDKKEKLNALFREIRCCDDLLNGKTSVFFFQEFSGKKIFKKIADLRLNEENG